MDVDDDRIEESILRVIRILETLLDEDCPDVKIKAVLAMGESTRDLLEKIRRHSSSS
jgi:hypothetical protein